jgi:phosphoadenosine phosphosulfate reductase
LPDIKEADRLSEELESKDAETIVAWALKKFSPRIALSSSFGAEDMVLIDMISKIDPRARVFTLDTARLNQETYDLVDEVRDRYKIDVEVYFPDTASVEKMVREHGLNLFYESVEFRKLCCGVRKVEPLNRALSGLDAWITGLRKDQTQTRATTRKLEADQAHKGIFKVNPLADWSSEAVWEYIRANEVPYNKLHDMGFPSIGCEPCTRAIRPGEDQRAGRWWWEESNKECGIHTGPTEIKVKTPP